MDPSGHLLMSTVMERTAETGLGRLFVICDCNMFVDGYLGVYWQDYKLAHNIASWALAPFNSVSGTLAFSADFTGSASMSPITVQLLSGSTVVETVQGFVQPDNTYEVAVSHTGTYDVRAKVTHWLSVKQTGVTVSNATTLDWSFDVNGDAAQDNSVNLLDLSTILADFNLTGNDPGDVTGDSAVNLLDLSTVLSNFNQVGQ